MNLSNMKTSASLKIFFLFGFVFTVAVAIVVSALLYSKKVNLPTALNFKPQTHSTTTFDTKGSEQISPNDTITGQGIANSFIELYITPSKTKAELLTDKSGNWSYTVPKDLKEGKYYLTIELLDYSRKINRIDSYQIKIVGKNIFDNFKKLNGIFNRSPIKEVKAQSSDEYRQWFLQLSNLGLIPVQEGGETVFYDADYYCNNISTCIRTPDPPAKIIDAIGRDIDFLYDLMGELNSQCYQPINALSDYFPNIYDLDQLHRTWMTPGYCYPAGLAGEIDENTLVKIINKVGLKHLEDQGNNPKTIFDWMITVTDPILNTRFLIDYLHTKPSLVTPEQTINLILTVAILTGPERTALNIGRDVEFDLVKAGAEFQVFRDTMKVGRPVPFEAIKNAAQKGAWYKRLPSGGGLAGQVVSKVLRSNSYKETGFDVYRELAQRQGHFVEVGGPTLGGYELINTSKLDRRLWITNVTPAGCEIYNPYSGELVNVLPIDFQLDATRMRFNDGSIGALFASCLFNNVRPQALSESARVLEQGGLLIWQGGREEDIYDAIQNGLIIKQSRRSVSRNNIVAYDLIFQKPISTGVSKYPVITRSTLWPDAERILGRVSSDSYNKIYYLNGNIPVPPRINRSTALTKEFSDKIMNAFLTGRAALIDKSIVSKIIDNHIAALSDFQRKTGKNLLVRFDNLSELSQNNSAYVVGDEFVQGNLAADYSIYGNYFTAKISYYQSPHALATLAHELMHAASNIANPKGFVPHGKSERDRIFTGLYELMIEAWSDLSNGVNIYSAISQFNSGGYSLGEYRDVYKFIVRLNNINPGYLNEFLSFGINADADQLVGRIFGQRDARNFLEKALGKDPYYTPNYQDFMAYFKQTAGIDFGAISYTSVGLATSALVEQGSPGKGTIAEPVVSFDEGFISPTMPDSTSNTDSDPAALDIQYLSYRPSQYPKLPKTGAGGGAGGIPCSIHPVNLGCIYGFGNILTLGEGVNRLTMPAFAIAAAAVVVYFLIGGVRFLLSGGDKNAVDSARRMITHAVIGFIILIFAYLILQFIPQFFGLKLLLF